MEVLWDYSPKEHSGPSDDARCCRLAVCPPSMPEHVMFGSRERRPSRARAPPPCRARAPPAAVAPSPPAGQPSPCRLLRPAAECGGAAPCRCAPPRVAAPPARGWPSAALILGVLMLSLAAPAAGLSPNVDLNSQKESGVCTSMDIRNSPQMFQVLSGCRVIEGFLQILLFDRFNETAYANLSFPELREITGYLFMYRVNGLRTLSTLFPNLAVIRGHKLFNNYAIVLYEMMNMQEIGLYSLTDISRGSVRIEKNYMMCYVSTIDWDIIAPNGKEGHFIKFNKPENECPVCLGEGGAVLSATMRHLCWNQDHYQKVCKSECGGRACSASGQCCDASCLGGCSGPLWDNCTVCRDLSIGDLRDRKCIRDCPNNTFKHQDRRCITESECRNLPRPKEINESEKVDRPYKPINGTCTLDCPPNFNEEAVNGIAVCQPCMGTCRKECSSMNVDSIQAIEQLRGCTHITGSLEISVRGGGSIVKELEEGLGQIQEITGSLKIARSYPLVSLNFLKSLKVIRGVNKFENDNENWNSFSVTDNQNLQELWDWDTHGPIDILRGKLYFHFNPKLCIEKIEPLRHMARATEFTELEVARNSNGDKVACNVTVLNVNVQSRSQESMILTWKSFIHDDSRSLLGYVVHTIEAPHQNITLYEGRDACGGDGWHVDDVQVPKIDTVFHLLTHLKPYTQYAIYVKTLTVATERLGAQSNIMYVRTLPGEPSPPRITTAVSLSPGSLMLKWEPPDQPNGNVTQYKVAVKWEEDREDFLMQRNYCIEPLVPNIDKPIVEVEDPIKEKEERDKKDKKDKKDEKCQCESKTWNDEEVLGQITFEDQLQNQVYQKRNTVVDTRRRRDVTVNKVVWGSHPLSDNQVSQPHQPPEFQTVKVKGVYNTFTKVLEKQTALNISDLRHYASHSISLWACREVEKAEFEEKHDIVNCSLKSIKTARTMKLEGADDVTGVKANVLQLNQSLGAVRMEWTEPARPNGLIITYHIQYKRIDLENHSPTTECITRQQFKNGGLAYIIKGLNAGNYSVRIMATSLAGNGNYSALKYFFIETSDSGVSVLMIVGVIIGAVVLVGALVVAALFIQRHFMSPPPPPPTKLIASVNPEYVSSVYVPDEWEVSRDKIQLIKELGQGSFGMVYEGIAQDLGKDGTEIRCAVKTVNEHATDRERIEFLNEASVMKAFDTAHVVRLLGVVSRGQPTLVVMELMASGDLKSYLRSHRPDQDKPRNAQPPSLARILQMAMEIADGMAYLSAKKFVHRDLAARNCMVAGDLTVKVGDFGMTRDIYETDYYRKGSKGLLPVRWMSPESLKDGVFTSSSDVWSYGVVLWEMATLASQPYQGLSNDQVLRYVIDGGVMERPENCPDRLYQLMQLTWQHRPAARPTFLQLVSSLATDANPVFRSNSFFFSTQGQDTFNQVQQAPAGVPEEPEPSVSGGQLGSWARGLASLDSDSSPPASPPASPRHSPSYRDMIRLVPFGERARADPHEVEALVGLSQSAPPPPGPKASPPQTTPNGYLPRSGNNGNPSSLSTSRC